MIELPPCKIVGVFGPVASGKTFLLKQWCEDQNRIVVFDCTGEFLEEPRYTQVFCNPAQLREVTKNSPYFFRIAYEPGKDLSYDFKWIMSCLWCIDSDKLLVVDEFHEICPVTYKSEDVNTLLRFARHDKLGFVGVSQRIADVHKLFTSSCRMVILFHTSEFRDHEAIRDRWGSKCLKMVTSLRPLIHDDQADTTQQVPQCVVVENRGQSIKVYDFESNKYTEAEDREQPTDAELGTEELDEETDLQDL